MPSRLLIWQLKRATAQLRRAREELASLDLEAAPIADMALDAQVEDAVRATAETDREHGRMQKTVQARETRRRRLLAEITRLDRRRDDLLDRM